MNTIIRGEEAWERLEKLPEEAAQWIDSSLEREIAQSALLPAETMQFLGALTCTSGKHLRDLVGAMHNRLIHERAIANLQLMLLLDVYPWRHQIAFVFTEHYRLKYKQTGVRWWLHTVLATKIEDIALPTEGEPRLGEAHDARADMLDASESEAAPEQATSNEERTPVD